MKSQKIYYKYPWEFDDADLLNSDDKSGIQESFDTAREGEVGGVGRTLVGVCNKELKIKINNNNLSTCTVVHWSIKKFKSTS